MSDPNTVLYYAHRELRHDTGEPFYCHASPSRRWVELHFLSHPIVKVRVRERQPSDPLSNYWGWLDAANPAAYTMVWPSEVQLDMCFPYGPQAEEARGRGRKVNLIVEEIPE